MSSITDFARSESILALAGQYVRWHLFRWLARRAAPLFVRGGDLLSVSPQVFGSHEPVVTAFLECCARNGHDDFLIDIGANIGLIACGCGHLFKRIEMFEPNPLCRQVLETNAMIGLEADSYAIHPFGLGVADGTATLVVPKTNWGAAYIKDRNNAYADDASANVPSRTTEPSFDVEIDVRSALQALGSLYAALEAKGLTQGVVKIDVEGYEPVVLQAIAKTLPPTMSIVIVFECLSDAFDLDAIIAAFNGRARLYRLAHLVSGRESMGSALRAVAFSRGLVSRLTPYRAGMKMQGDLVMTVERADRAAA